MVPRAAPEFGPPAPLWPPNSRCKFELFSNFWSHWALTRAGKLYSYLSRSGLQSATPALLFPEKRRFMASGFRLSWQLLPPVFYYDLHLFQSVRFSFFSSCFSFCTHSIFRRHQLHQTATIEYNEETISICFLG